MSAIVDDKSAHCIPFILGCLERHREQAASTGKVPDPFFVGLQGIQGAGKTTLVETLCSTLSSQPYDLPCAVLSIDDLYLPHSEQIALAEHNADNPLVQHRGQPGTHDIELGVELFSAIAQRQREIKLPSYDKSAFSGAGDRRPPEDWQIVNKTDTPTIEVVIFEGWCVGFRPLSDDDLEGKWKAARHSYDTNTVSYGGRLGHVRLEDVVFVNQCLKGYNALTDKLTCFIQIDAEDTQYVYDWREQQEAALRQSKGKGMTIDQVRIFVDGYYPAYELYTDTLRNGIFKAKKKQLRLVVDKNRRVTAVCAL